MKHELEQHYEIARLIAAKLTGTLTEEEATRLQQWLEVSPQHAEEYLQIRQRLLHDLKDTDRLDLFAEWRKFARRVGYRKKLYVRWSLAAAACVLFAIGMGIWFWPGGENTPVAVMKPAPHVKSYKAILVFDDNRQIPIDTSRRKIVVDERMSIAISGKTVTYERKEGVADSTVKYHTIKIPRGGEYSLTLADGSQVWLNSESLLTYPVTFTGDTREVYMEGEVCFDVTKNERQPFIVKTKDVSVKVLGTCFNMEAYPGESFVTATLVRGKIDVTGPSGSRIIGPDQQVIVGEGRLDVKQVYAEEYVRWITGVFCFTEAPLSEIMQKLARWYDVKVFFAAQSLKDIKFTMEVQRYEDISMILSKVEKIGRVRFTVNGDVVTVTD